MAVGLNRELNTVPSEWPELVVHMGVLVVCGNLWFVYEPLLSPMATQVRTLVDSIGHSLKQLPEEAQRHPRLAREVRNAFSLSLLDLSMLTQLRRAHS
jgi:hypothetical protein